MDKTEQANSFLNIIRSIINEEQNKLDRVEICQIDSVNEDGTVNIKMLSDFETVRIIPNISNQSIYSFKSGDLAIIYMIQNQLSNAFIIAKCGPTNESLRISSSDGNTTGDGTVIQNITYQNVTASGVTSVNGKTGEVTITAQDLGAITEIPDVTQIQSTDISSLVYDTTNGAAFEINNSIIFSDGTENNSLLKFNLPIIGINGISIDKANGKNVLEISGKDLQDLINSISLTSGTNNGTLKLTVGATIVDNIKVTGFDQKQDQLSTSQLNAVNSGITSDKVTTYDGYQAKIDAKYTKPTGGIPKTDLSLAVQTSLGKADSALQSHQQITTGSANGTISVDGSDVAVKGLKALAYKDSLTKTDVGLGNVNNTSDAEKPISTATQAALNTKQDSLTTTQLNAVNSGITSDKVTTYDGYQSQISAKYTKPNNGIPKTDLDSSVQTSLGKADTALQTHQTITTGSANGTIAVGGTDVAVKGLGSLAYKNSLTKSDVGLGSVVNAGQDSTPTANSNNYITSGGVKNYVDTAISGISQFKYEVVTSLQTASANTMGKIYLVAHSHSSNDGYDEYITLESGTTTKTYSWEKIGNTDIDLSNYVNNLSGTANSGVVTNITKSGNILTVTSSNLSGTQTASNGKYISGITQDKTGKITSISESTLPSNTAHGHTAGTGLNVSGSGGVSGTTTYSLKVASSSEIGGVKPGTTSGKTYGVDVADDGTMTVSVPWTDNDTTYSAGTHISIDGTTINASWPTASDSGYAGINKTGTVTGVKVNGTTKSPVDGVVDIGPVPNVVQTTGTSTTNVMSQNSITNELNKKADLFIKETVISQISSGKSYELGNVSSMANFPTINSAEFTSINDVSQICFTASANFTINMPSTTYLCIGDGLSSDKTKLTTVSGKSYCITVGYTPFGIQIVSAIVDVL